MKWFLYKDSDFSNSDYDRCLSLMETGRKEKLLSGKHLPSRKMSVFGEWVAKNELAKISGIPYENIKLERTDKGKPYAVNLPYQFSVSHSDNLLALAIDKNNIGIDIEIIKPTKADVTKALCTESDLAFLNKATDEKDYLLRFYKIWTAKEAYFKMLGTGITNLKGINYQDLKPQHFIKKNCIITIILE